MQLVRNKEIKLSLKSICWFLLGTTLVSGNIAKHSIIFQIAAISFISVSFTFLFLKKEIRFNKFHFITLLFIFYNSMLVFSKLAVEPIHSFNMIKTISINLILSIIIFSFLSFTKDTTKMLNTYIYSSVFSVVVILFVYRDSLFTGRLAISWGDSISNYTLFGIKVITAGPNGIAYFCAIAFILSTYFFIKNRRARYLLFDILFVFTILATGSRKGLVILIFGLFIVLNLLLKRNKKVIYITVAMMFCLLLYYLIHSIPVLYEVIGSRMDELINMVLKQDVNDSSINTRVQLIEIGITYFKDRPIYGYGLDAFRVIGPWGIITDNNYIEILVSSGIIGFIIYYSYVFVVLYDYASIKNKSDICKTLFWVFLITLAMEYGSVIYFERNFDFIHSMLYYILYLSKKERKHELSKQ